MLQAIRDNAQGFIAWVIVALLVIVFAFWGLQSTIMDGGGSVDVAKVEGASITQQEFEQRYRTYRENQRQRLLQAFGNDPNNPLFKQLFDDQRMQKTVLDDMIQGRLLTVTATDAGFFVSEESLDDQIRDDNRFKVDGKYDPETFKNSIRTIGLSSAGYKSRLAQNTVINQFVTGLTSSAFVTPAQTANWLALQNQQREVAVVTLSAENLRPDVTINDEMIQAYYENNADRFMNDEMLTVDYIEFSADTLIDTAKFGESELVTYYNDNINDYAVVDTVKQMETLAELRRRALAGEDFAALAKEASDDSFSAAKGGDLGLLGRTDIDPVFAEAAFALDKGELSQPVQTDAGLHLIKVVDIKDERRQISHILLKIDNKKLRTRSFDEARAQVEADMHRQRADKLFEEKFQLLNNLTYEQRDTLEPAATELKLEIKTSQPFTRAGAKEGIATNPVLVAAAYNEDVLAGNNSEPIEVGDERYIVLRVNNYKPSTVKPLAEVNETIIENLMVDASKRLAREKGEQLLAEAKKGKSLEELAKINSGKWLAPQLVKRTENKPAVEIVRALFALPRPAEGSPVYTGVSLQNGDYAIVQFSGVTEADASKTDEATLLDANRRIQRSQADAIGLALTTDMRQRADVTIYSDTLKEAVAQ